MSEREVARYFFDKTGRKATPALFGQSLGQVKTLLLSGFTEEEIKKGIDYLVENPPKNGFRSLGFLSYCLDDILLKIKVKELRERASGVITQINETQEATNNVQKFLNQKEVKVKGTGKF